MENFIIRLNSISEPKMAFMLCALFIFSDIITGYLKAGKFKTINSSISRDGYIKKIGWFVSLLIGYIINILIGIDLILIGTMLVCVATEGISVYENLAEIGVNLPFKNYFEKLKNNEENKEE